MALTLEGVAEQIRAAGFHPQRLQLAAEMEHSPPRLLVEDWSEFCATTRALGAAVVFFETVPFSAADLPLPGDRRPIWEVLPEAAWLAGHAGELPSVTYLAFFAGGVLELTQEAAWWAATDDLFERAKAVGAQERQRLYLEDRDAWIEELARVLPQDEAFRRLALSPRPPITDLRARVEALYPDRKRNIPGLRLFLYEQVKAIKEGERARRKAKR